MQLILVYCIYFNSIFYLEILKYLELSFLFYLIFELIFILVKAAAWVGPNLNLTNPPFFFCWVRLGYPKFVSGSFELSI